jgi:hypothetical protein
MNYVSIIMMLMISMQAMMTAKAFLVLPSMTSRAFTIQSSNTNHRVDTTLVRYNEHDINHNMSDRINHMSDRLLIVENDQRHMCKAVDGMERRIERQLADGLKQLNDKIDTANKNVNDKIDTTDKNVNERFKVVETQNVALLVGVAILGTAEGMQFLGPIIGKAVV